jgi:ADP-ribose diphosphatase
LPKCSGRDFPVAKLPNYENLLYIVSMSTSRRTARNSVRVVSSRKMFTSRVFDVVSEQVQEPGNIQVRRDIVRHPGSIVILALDESRRPPHILLERQYRHAAAKRMWELPAGSLEPGEAKLPAAKRELLEETGYTAKRWERALEFYVSPGFLTESMLVFLARGLKKGQAQPEDDERIAVRFFPLAQAVRMATSGKIIDAKTIAGLLWLEKKLARL